MTSLLHIWIHVHINMYLVHVGVFDLLLFPVEKINENKSYKSK